MDLRMKQRIIYAVRRQHNRIIWHKILTVMAAIVVFCTTYALILPAITMERDTICGLEEHIHTDECYSMQSTNTECSLVSLGVHIHTSSCFNESNQIMCGYSDFVIHEHNTLCYDNDGNLICLLPEIREHHHDHSCYEENKKLICDIEESVGHQHSEGCFLQTKNNLICGIEENDEHQHNDACYEWANELICDKAEQEGHVHSDACYITELILTCDKAEVIAHTHCADCFDNNGVLICGITETQIHEHTNDCIHENNMLMMICGLEEHTHSETCYENYEPKPKADILLSATTQTGAVITIHGAPESFPDDGMNLVLTAEEVFDGMENFDSILQDIGVMPQETHLFDIRLWQNGLEIEPFGEITLSISYMQKEIPCDDVQVFHFDEINSTVTDMEAEVSDSGSIVIDTDHFSLYGIAFNVPQTYVSTPYVAQVYAPDYIGTINTANQWQIVSGQYSGNEQSYKIAPSNDVYLQKNVVPTDVENEFLVYLSMDKKMTWETFLDSSTVSITTAGNWKNRPIGTITANVNGNFSSHLLESGNQENYTNRYYIKFNIYQTSSSDTPIYTYYDWRYGTTANCSNGTAFLNAPGLGYVVVAQEVNLHNSGTGTGNPFELNIYLDKLSADFATYNTSFESVIDQMGDNIIFEGYEMVDGAVDYDVYTKTLTWTPVDNPDVVSVVLSDPLRGWENNICQLVYKVKLNVETDEDGSLFNSCASNMHSAEADIESYKVNNSASLTYRKIPLQGSNEPVDQTAHTVDYPIPYVRGLLYNLDLIKKDENGRMLPNAEFTLMKEDQVIDVLTTDNNGYLKFTDLPYGTYTLIESNPPLGYAGNTFNQNIDLCFTIDGYNKLQVDIPDWRSNMVYVENGRTLEILNGTNQGGFSLTKFVDSNVPDCDTILFPFTLSFSYGERTLAGDYTAQINPGGINTVITLDNNGRATVSLKHGQTLIIYGLPTDTSYIVEENADGYITTWQNAEGIIKQNVLSHVECTNKRYVADLQIHKVDLNGHDIANTEFTIYDAVVNDESWSKELTDSSGIVLKTDINGQVAFAGLPTGAYLLYETASAPGFYCPNEPWRVLVNEIGNIAITSPDGTSLPISNDWVTVVNYSTVVLPNTGGIGTHLYIGAGAILMLFTSLVYIKRNAGRGGKKANS